jgi:hypothetical protein
MSEFRLKNYTTNIEASKSIYEIEEVLRAVGADAIMKNYRGDGRVEALVFKLQGRGYKLPANTEKCAEALIGSPGYVRATKQKREEQGELDM